MSVPLDHVITADHVQKIDFEEQLLRQKALQAEEDSLYGRTPKIGQKKEPGLLDVDSPPPKFNVGDTASANVVQTGSEQNHAGIEPILPDAPSRSDGKKKVVERKAEDSPPLGEVQSENEEDDADFRDVVRLKAPSSSKAKSNRHMRIPDDYRYVTPTESDDETKSPPMEEYHDAQDHGPSSEGGPAAAIDFTEKKRKSIQKVPDSRTEEVESDEGEEALVEVAKLGRMHGSMKKSSAATSVMVKSPKLSPSSSPEDLTMTGAGDSETIEGKPARPDANPVEEKIIKLLPKESRGQDDAGENYHMRILEKHESHPDEEYRLTLTKKDQDTSHEKLAIKLDHRDSFAGRKPSSLPEVVPPMNEKMITLPGDDKIPLPGHDEKIPDDRPQMEKEVSPQDHASLYVPPQSSNQADEKVLGVYIDPEGEIYGGDYFVGKPDDLTGRQSIDGRAPLKVAPDGTVLIPQPSDDPNDPLNWSWLKKNSTFWALLLASLLTDFVVYYGLPLFNDQAYEWDKPVKHIQRSVAAAAFMQAVGALTVVPLTQRLGRLPVLFWSQLLTMIATVAATYTSPYNGFAFFRAIQGLFGVGPQVIGLSICHDIFFFHERARKINFWLCFTFIGPYLGAFLSGLVVQRLQWRDTFAVVCGLFGVSILAVVFLADETLFNASNPWPKTGGAMERVLTLSGFVGAIQPQGRPTLWQSLKHVFSVVIRPYVIVPTICFVIFLATSTIGIISIAPSQMRLQPYYFTSQNTALLLTAPVVGTVLANLWGRWFNDFLCFNYVRSHQGRFNPEWRLWAIYPATAIACVGLVLVGQAWEQRLQWGAIAIGWAMVAFGILATNVVLAVYLVDVLPFHAASSSAWLVFFRSMGAFAAPHFQAKWVKWKGPAHTFGIQAALVAGFMVMVIITQAQGSAWRKRFPAPKPKKRSI